MVKFNKSSKLSTESESVKIKLLVIAALLLILIGHSIAFDDEVAQNKINSESATYVNDNNSSKGE